MSPILHLLTLIYSTAIHRGVRRIPGTAFPHTISTVCPAETVETVSGCTGDGDLSHTTLKRGAREWDTSNAAHQTEPLPKKNAGLYPSNRAPHCAQ